MKITGLSTTAFQCTESKSRENTNGLNGNCIANDCFIELETNSGLVGLAFSSADSLNIISELVQQVLLNQDPRAVHTHWKNMSDHCLKFGHGALVNSAIAALDIALWDLKAKANNEPLWKTLGSLQPNANTYYSICKVQDTTTNQTDLEELVNKYGFKECKIKSSTNPDNDLSHLSTVYKALKQNAKQPVLMLDAEETWSTKQAVRRIKELESQFDITFVEAPCNRWDYRAYKQISNQVNCALSNSKLSTSAADLLPFFDHRSVDVIQGSVDQLGISGLLQIADTAFGFELPITLSSALGNIQTHIAGALPYFMSIEIIHPEPPENWIDTPVFIKDGRAKINDCIGHGLTINKLLLKQSATKIITKIDYAHSANAC